MKISLHKKFLTTLVLFFALFELFTFCTPKTYTCAAFSDPESLAWIPYQHSQLLIFANAAGQKDTVPVTGIDISKDTKVTVSACSKTGGCDAHHRVNGNSYNSGSVFPFYYANTIYNSLTGTPQNQQVTLQLGQFIIYASKLTDTGFVNLSFEKNYHSYFSPSVTLNGSVFTNTQRISKTDTNAVFTELYISRNMGIVGYVKKANNTLYVKQ